MVLATIAFFILFFSLAMTVAAVSPLWALGPGATIAKPLKAGRTTMDAHREPTSHGGYLALLSLRPRTTALWPPSAGRNEAGLVVLSVDEEGFTLRSLFYVPSFRAPFGEVVLETGGTFVHCYRSGTKRFSLRFFPGAAEALEVAHARFRDAERHAQRSR